MTEVTTPTPEVVTGEKKSTPWFLIAIVSLAVFAAVAMMIGLNETQLPPGPAQVPALPAAYTPARSTPPKITIEVTGSNVDTADLTYSYGSGTSQGKVSLPFKVSGTEPSGTFLYISAQNTGEYGYVECKISVDGVVLSHNTGSGAYAIAQCDGTAP